jgi:glycosyltransferase involved in cell wall biosynthesis
MSPSITIITSTLNCAGELKLTADSVRSQRYTNIQWIVADGGSTDGTIEIIESNSDIISKSFTEKDKGIYDAWNKACKFISNDWVIFLGAGDVFDSTTSLADFWDAAELDGSNEKIVYGNVIFLDRQGNSRYVSRKPSLEFWEFGRPALPHHQGTFQHHSLFKLYSFDTSYRVAADSKFLLSALQSFRSLHVDVNLTKMYANGISNNVKNLLNIELEIERVCHELRIGVPWVHKAIAVTERRFVIVTNYCFPSFIILRVKKILDRYRQLF